MIYSLGSHYSLSVMQVKAPSPIRSQIPAISSTWIALLPQINQHTNLWCIKFINMHRTKRQGHSYNNFCILCPLTASGSPYWFGFLISITAFNARSEGFPWVRNAFIPAASHEGFCLSFANCRRFWQSRHTNTQLGE